MPWKFIKKIVTTTNKFQIRDQIFKLLELRTLSTQIWLFAPIIAVLFNSKFPRKINSSCYCWKCSKTFVNMRLNIFECENDQYFQPVYIANHQDQLEKVQYEFLAQFHYI